MNETLSAVRQASNPTPPDLAADFAAIKARQQGAWSSGDDAGFGTTLQIVGEQLCEALDIRAGDKVLNVAACKGNVSLAAARHWCDVTATDYVRLYWSGLVSGLLPSGSRSSSPNGDARCESLLSR